MYLEYFSFSCAPFRLSPDNRFFFNSSQHGKAMAFLDYGLAEGEGFIVVTGEVGAGKTTLVDRLLSTVDASQYVIARIVTTQLSSADLIRMVAAAFGVHGEGKNKAALLLELKYLFERLSATLQRPLLIVDEAQSLTAEAIEELRMLTNLQSGGEGALQVLLLGQPEFRQLLSNPGFEQLRQRISASYHLGPLGEEETRLYVEHRLRQAGWQGNPQISADAFRSVHRHTGGIPRKINRLFSRVLLLACLDRRSDLDAETVESVALELAAELGGAAHGLFPSEGAATAAFGGSTAAVPDSLELRLSQLEGEVARQGQAIRLALDAALAATSHVAEEDQ